MIERPLLMGLQEIQNLLGRSRQRIQQLTERADFPPPYQTLAMGRVWLAADVEAWIRKYRPAHAPPQRPARQGDDPGPARSDSR